jgi:hypothetical protein
VAASEAGAAAATAHQDAWTLWFFFGRLNDGSDDLVGLNRTQMRWFDLMNWDRRIISLNLV